jgi:hypothetical protein
MKIPVIKKLVETYKLDELYQAEKDLMDKKDLAIEIENKDEGEKLTHILAAIWIIEKMRDSSVDFMTALRAYTQKVRDSIS